MRTRAHAFARALGLLAFALAPDPAACRTPAAETAALAAVRARPAEDEVIYFLLPDRFDNADPSNDRGGLAGDRSRTGFDPADKAFFHGGDLKGVIRRLDYIQGLGATAIWLGPVFRNKPVQGPPGHESAGYHGYWIEDFLHVDPHFGTDADYKALVDAAHARGLKVYMDIVINHTADVIRYRECPGFDCPYRSRADYPYGLRGGDPSAPINRGFAGDAVDSAANYAHLTDPRWAYTPYLPAGEEHAKNPDWLNDPIYYHNRGNSTFAGESSTMGDFFGLDDLMTENPRVIAGMIEIYESWIDRYGVDGFRIDTEQHVDAAFWRAFVPAILAHAKARGIPNFAIFGEVATFDVDPARQAEHTWNDLIPGVLDFSFKNAVVDAVAGEAGTDKLERLFAGDPLYRGGEAAARQLPTFIGNHDHGRFAFRVTERHPGLPRDELLARDLLAHAMLLTLRGAPTIYSGDEQGFVGSGGDQDARQDMFASQTPSYRSERLLGQDKTGATDSFGTGGTLYRAIAALSHLRTAHPALTGGRQLVRYAQPKPGLFAVSRFDPHDGHELLIAFNTSAQPITAKVQVEVASRGFASLVGTCPSRSWAPGSLAIQLPAFGYAVCEARPR